MPTLVAKTRLKFGSKVATRALDGRVTHVEGTKNIAPGETFEADADTAKQMIADGSAMTQADERAKGRDSMSAEAKLREAVEEANAAGLIASVSIGAPADIAAAVHREKQEAETAAVEEATAAGKKSSAKTSGKDKS